MTRYYWQLSLVFLDYTFLANFSPLESIIAPFLLNSLWIYGKFIPLSSDRENFLLVPTLQLIYEFHFSWPWPFGAAIQGSRSVVYHCHLGISLHHHPGNSLCPHPPKFSLFWTWCFHFSWSTLSFWTKYASVSILGDELVRVPTGSIWPTQRGQLKRL